MTEKRSLLKHKEILCEMLEGTVDRNVIMKKSDNDIRLIIHITNGSDNFGHLEDEKSFVKQYPVLKNALLAKLLTDPNWGSIVETFGAVVSSYGVAGVSSSAVKYVVRYIYINYTIEAASDLVKAIIERRDKTWYYQFENLSKVIEYMSNPNDEVPFELWINMVYDY